MPGRTSSRNLSEARSEVCRILCFPSGSSLQGRGIHLPASEHTAAAAAAAKSLQLYPTLCNRIDGSPPGSSVPGILQARTLEWVAISFSNA